MNFHDDMLNEPNADTPTTKPERGGIRPKPAEAEPTDHGSPSQEAAPAAAENPPKPVSLADFQTEDTPPPPADAVDIASFMVDDDEMELLGGEQTWDEVPVVKPKKSQVIMVHRDAGLRVQLLSFQDDEAMEDVFYLITPPAAAFIPELVLPVVYVPYVTPKGTVKLWPIKARRDAKGELNRWSRTALTLCNKYAGQWIRVIPDDGFYRAQLMKLSDEPSWPEELSRQALIDRAFTGKLIQDRAHPVIQHMMGG